MIIAVLVESDVKGTSVCDVIIVGVPDTVVEVVKAELENAVDAMTVIIVRVVGFVERRELPSRPGTMLGLLSWAKGAEGLRETQLCVSARNKEKNDRTYDGVELGAIRRPGLVLKLDVL